MRHVRLAVALATLAASTALIVAASLPANTARQGYAKRSISPKSMVVEHREGVGQRR